MTAHERKLQITLTFADEETADYVKLVSRRKGVSLEEYILDNLEWDEPIECLSAYNDEKKITKRTCEDCEYIETCPDAVKTKAGAP